MSQTPQIFSAVFADALGIWIRGDICGNTPLAFVTDVRQQQPTLKVSENP